MPYKNREEKLLSQKKWYQKNKERLLIKRRSHYDCSSAVRKLWAAAKQRANIKGLEFSIVPEDIVFPEVCPILGQPLKRLTRYAPSIDRKDSTKGYTKENVWVISRRANLMKNDATVEDLRKFAEWAKTFQLS